MTDMTWTSGDVPQDLPNPARMYDYSLVGYHNFAVDRRPAEEVATVFPDLSLALRANRSFLRRAVSFFSEQGVDQFLDLGSGIPTVGNVHEIAKQLNPAARIVYVDNDPITVCHRQLIRGQNPNATVIQADARQITLILNHPEKRP